MPRKTKDSQVVQISYGNLEDLIEAHLRFMKVLKDDDNLLDIKWPLGNEHLNLCQRKTILDLEITTIKE